MPALLLFILALGMAIYSFRQFRRGRWRLSLVMLIFWCVLAVQLVTGQKWLQLILVFLLLPAAYFRFIAKDDQEKKTDTAVGSAQPAAPDSASPVADETEPGFDRLIDVAEQQPSREHFARLNRALFSLNEWHSVMVERDGEMQPFAGMVEDAPALLLFTDADRAQSAFALIDRLYKPGEVRLGIISPAEMVRDPEPYRALGVKRLQFNLRYYLPLDGLRDQYYYVMRPHDFKRLVAEAELEDGAKLMALWQSLFDLPKWFFLVNRGAEENKPALIGGEVDGDRVVFLFLTYDFAIAEAQRMAVERGGGYDVHIMPPAEGFRLIVDMQPDGVLLRDEGVTAGAKLEKLKFAHDLFCA